MSKEAFLAALRVNLRGLAATTIDEIIADYASHFDEGLAAGRREQDVAAALGDPARLARELRAEAGLKRWDEEPSVSAAVGAVLALLSLGAIDLLILLPVLLVVFSIVFVVACIGGFMAMAGVIVLVVSPLTFLGGGFIPVLLAGMGLLWGGLALFGLVALLAIGLTNTLVAFGRFHLRLIKPIAS